MYNLRIKDIIKSGFNYKPIVILVLFPYIVTAQEAGRDDTLLKQATLENCIHYAIQRNPELKNAVLDEEITETTIKSKLADWYPQVNFNYDFQHNFQLPTSNFNGQYVNIGSKNTSGVQFGATQNIFNRDVVLASRTARSIRLQSQQSTAEQRINIAAQVSKAFYDVILTVQQLRIIDEDINRISLSLKDAFYQYQGGITDKTDYKRAAISLNNAKAQKKNGEESLKAKYAYLKELIGFPSDNNFELQYDTTRMKQEIFIDTLQNVNYNNRIEIKLLQTQRTLQQYNVKYNQWSFLPDVSAFGNYNLNFLNNNFSKIYSRGFPNSYTGLLFTVPIFQGGKRLQQIKQARLQLEQVTNSIESAQHSINTQYAEALATYKSNLYSYITQEENVNLAKEVYDVIQLQYRNGIKTYLEVINSEADLRTAQINYYNALYQVLSSKIDVQQSLGTISY